MSCGIGSCEAVGTCARPDRGGRTETLPDGGDAHDLNGASLPGVAPDAGSEAGQTVPAGNGHCPASLWPCKRQGLHGFSEGSGTVVTIDVHTDGEQCWWGTDCDEPHHQENITGDERDAMRVCEVCGH